MNAPSTPLNFSMTKFTMHLNIDHFNICPSSIFHSMSHFLIFGVGNERKKSEKMKTKQKNIA